MNDLKDDLVVGVDVGGTKIAVLVATLEGSVLGRATGPSVADQTGAADAIVASIEMALAGAGLSLDNVRVVGIGVPGRVDPVTGHVAMAVLGESKTTFEVIFAADRSAELGRPVAMTEITG